MKIAITGSSGFIGSALVRALREDQHRVVRLVRSQPRPGGDEVQWDPEGGAIDLDRLEGFAAVVHLAGENIAQGRWTRAKRNRIWDSRVKASQMLCRALLRLESPPHTIIGASAIGFYGNRGDEILEDGASSGGEFLAEVCRYWEAAIEPASAHGIRVVHLRLGMVLGPGGGALAALLPFFRMGLGGTIGGGEQYWSWIALEDVLGAIQFILKDEAIKGPVNAVSPEPVTNREFTKTLGRALHRPTLFPVPAFAARLAMGRMADEMLLASARVQPARLLEAGYAFRYPQLEQALRYALQMQSKAMNP